MRREISRIVLAMDRVPPEAEALYMNLPVHSRVQVLDRNELWLLGFVVGELERARALSEHQAEAALRDGRLFEAALGLSYLAQIEVALGDFDGAQEHSRAAFDLGERVGANSTFFLNAMAAPSDLARARDEGIEALVPIGETNLRTHAPDHAYGRAIVQAFLALAYARTGGDPEAVLCAARTVLPAVRQAPGWSQNYTQLLDLVCEACWRVERPDLVDVLEPNLRSKVLEPDFRRANTDARLSMARLAALSKRFDEATEWFAASRRVLGAQGARPLRAIADFEEALMYLRRDGVADRTRARPLLDSALRRFDSIGMPGWRRRAVDLLATLE
ncbi:MAG: hypothetical protein GY937_01435 [bacterium]|nr:hypothetical protein [bacterium]